METTACILKTIAKEINRNPLWAMLRAREYLCPKHPLFRAYRTKAKKACQTLSYPTLAASQVESILAGEALANLEELKPLIRPLPAAVQRRVVGEDFFSERVRRQQALPGQRRGSCGISLTTRGRGGYTSGANRTARTVSPVKTQRICLSQRSKRLSASKLIHRVAKSLS